MIIIDMNQVMISNLMGFFKQDPLNENWIRKVILESIHSYHKKYSREYGNNVVLAYDSKHYWRKDYFPYYKASRKNERKVSGLDWVKIFDLLNQIKNEIKEHFNLFTVLEVHGAEADDIISVLCRNKNSKEKILIMSADKDFIQLQKYPGVYQYNPSKKQYVTSDSPYYFIKEHIIRGDKSDGIPNILSDDDTFVCTDKTQKRITQRNLNVWIDQDPSMFCKTTEHRENYLRNKILIDLDCIPEELEQTILNAYMFEALNKDRKNLLFEYLRNHKMYDLLNNFYTNPILK